MQNNFHHLKSLMLYSSTAVILLTATACQLQTANDSDNNPSTVAEIETCSSSTTYASFATVTGAATFSKRGLAVTQSANKVTGMILSAPISSNLPIRFAEIRVLNSAGALVQCGKTDSAGLLKGLDAVTALKIPTTTDTYTIQVMSRSNHTMSVVGGKTPFMAVFSIKEDIYSNTLYKIISTINVTGAGTFPTNLNATALESVSTKIEGGAFNIYNNFITSYEYLAASTALQDLTCLSPKLSAYWKAGFNPNQYVSPSSDPGTLPTVSFYLRTDKELYLNGGRVGNVTSDDTDHFDDAVVIHELGHHIENVCGTMESPGGSHQGSSRIDPRLAWSEGWGNFFAAHVIKNKIANINPDLSALLPNNEWLFYYDSKGYTDGAVTTGGEYIRINMARSGTAIPASDQYPSSYDFDSINSTTNPGESHFREVSVSRGLFKITNTCAAPFANCINADNFNDIWKSFEKQSTGMGQSMYPFRSSARLFDRLKSIKGGSLGTLNPILTTDEAFELYGDTSYDIAGPSITWVPYGIKLISNGATPCSKSLQIEPHVNASLNKSDQRFSNHFYYIDKSTIPTVTAINLTATYVGGTASLDLDLVLFNENYHYNEDCNGTCSRTTSSDVLTSSRGPTSTESISISGLASSSKYILNVRAYTPGVVATGTKYNYILTDQSGGYLCPIATF